MKTIVPFIHKTLIVLGAFGITTFVVFGSSGNGGTFFKSTPYQTKNAQADATLSSMTNGAGAGILDTVVANIKAKAEIKAGTPLDVTAYNAYIDEQLGLLDKLDNDIRAEAGPDYAFLFQYIYPRVYDLKKPANKTASFIDRILSAMGAGTWSVTTQTTKTPTSVGPTSAPSFGPSGSVASGPVQCVGAVPSGPGVVVSPYSSTSFGGGGTNGTAMVNSDTNPGRSGCTWTCSDGYMVNEAGNGCRTITDKDFVAKREPLLSFPAYKAPIKDPAEVARLQSIRDYAKEVLKNGTTTEALKILADTANKPEYSVSSWEMATALNMTWEEFSRMNNKESIKYTNDAGGVWVPGASRAKIPPTTETPTTSTPMASSSSTTSSAGVTQGTFIGSCPWTPGKDNTAFYCGPTNPGAGWTDVWGGCYHQCIAQ